MLVTIIFSLDFSLIFCLQFFEIWSFLLCFFERHCFSITLLLPANHTWPVKSHEVGYVHVVDESKIKQTSKPQPLPAENPSSDPWQYNLGRNCCCSQAWSAAHVLSGGTIFPQVFWCASWPCQRCREFLYKRWLNSPSSSVGLEKYTKNPGQGTYFSSIFRQYMPWISSSGSFHLHECLNENKTGKTRGSIALSGGSRETVCAKSAFHTGKLHSGSSGLTFAEVSLCEWKPCDKGWHFK